jgi:acetyl esterase/lipase
MTEVRNHLRLKNGRFSVLAFGFLGAVGIQALAAPTYSNITFATYSTLPGAKDCKLDVYIPSVGLPPYPVLVYVHGGGWSGGSRTGTGDVPIDVLAYGIATVAIDYRLTSQAHQFGTVDGTPGGAWVTVTWPAQIHDCKAAVRWICGNAATYGFDTNRICAFGTSAGGHLVAAMGALNGVLNYTRNGQTIDMEGTVGNYDNFPSHLMAVCDYFGPSDILNLAPDVTTPPGCVYDFDASGSPSADLVGSTAYAIGVGQIRANLNSPTAPYPFLAATTLSAGPVTFARSGLPPMFIAHGDADAVVPSYQSVRLNNALLANGSVSRFTMVSGGTHGNLGPAMRTAAVSWIVGVLKGTLVCPAITAQPQPQTVTNGGAATFAVGATGTGPLSYQWQKNQSNLSNSGHYSGCNSNTLTIIGADDGDVANYRCVVSNTCGAIITTTATLTVGVTTNPPTAPVANPATGTSSNAFTANWSGSTDAAGYRLDVSTNNSFADFVSGYQDLDVGTALSWNVSGLPVGSTCYYRVRAYNSNGTSGNSATITVALITPEICPPTTLVNADFEGGTNANGVAVGWTGYQRTPNPTTVWTVQTNSPPDAGSLQYQQIANTSSTGGGGVRQDISGCVVGATYAISGWMRGNSQLYSTCTVKVSPSASTSWPTAIDLNPSQSVTGSTWVPFSGNVVATGTNMTLWLDGQTGSTGLNKAECFDSVTVTCAGLPVPLRFESVSLPVQNQVAFVLSGPPGGTVTILCSSNLVNWTTLTNLVNTTGTLQFTAEITNASSQQFYRAISP